MHLSATSPILRTELRWFAAEPNNVLSHEAFIAPSNTQSQPTPGDGCTTCACHVPVFFVVTTERETSSMTIKSSQVSSNRTSPTSVQTTDTTVPVSTNNNSSQSSNQITPSSSNQLSSNSPSSQISSNSSTQRTSIRKDIPHRHSAFKPYANQNKNVSLLTRNETVLTPYNVQATVAPISTDIHAEQMETIVSNLGKSRQGHICIYCGKIYSRKYGLKIHIRTHTGYKPLKCKYCLRPFGDPSNLNKHVRLHVDGETSYKCALCGKVLVRKRDLERHLKSRHEENRDMDRASDTSSDGLVDV